MALYQHPFFKAIEALLQWRCLSPALPMGNSLALVLLPLVVHKKKDSAFRQTQGLPVRSGD
ncbi:MAG: hypothetical protein ABIH46_12600, partial [Chloroflexota bacterium]